MHIDSTIRILHKEILNMEDMVVSFGELQRSIPKMLIIKSRAFIGGHKVTEQYKPDPTLTASTFTLDGKEIQFSQLFSAIGDDLPPHHVMLTGSVGVGKSTLLKHFSKETVRAVDGLENDSGLRHIQLVLYLEFKYMSNDEKVFLRDLLIGQQTPKIEENQ